MESIEVLVSFWFSSSFFRAKTKWQLTSSKPAVRSNLLAAKKPAKTISSTIGGRQIVYRLFQKLFSSGICKFICKN
jgi:hypothetical protein